MNYYIYLRIAYLSQIRFPKQNETNYPSVNPLYIL